MKPVSWLREPLDFRWTIWTYRVNSLLLELFEVDLLLGTPCTLASTAGLLAFSLGSTP